MKHLLVTMKHLLLMIGFCVACSGCTLGDNFARTVVIEPLQYCQYVDGHLSHWRHCHLARDAWKATQAKKGGKRLSDDYGRGFCEGFTDYLDAGGTGEPPPLPPRRYWKNRYATPQGRQAVQDWFAGFGVGAAMAMQSGARELVIVPSSTPGAGIPGEYISFENPRPPLETIVSPPPDGALPNGVVPDDVLLEDLPANGVLFDEAPFQDSPPDDMPANDTPADGAPSDPAPGDDLLLDEVQTEVSDSQPQPLERPEN